MPKPRGLAADRAVRCGAVLVARVGARLGDAVVSARPSGRDNFGRHHRSVALGRRPRRRPFVNRRHLPTCLCACRRQQAAGAKASLISDTLTDTPAVCTCPLAGHVTAWYTLPDYPDAPHGSMLFIAPSPL